MLLFFSLKADLLVLALSLCRPPIRMLRSLNLRLKELAPMVEKLVVRLTLAALIAVTIIINAKMPRAIIATVKPVRNLLPEIFRQDKASVSLKVMCDGIDAKVSNRI